jgi:hypothetical protein
MSSKKCPQCGLVNYSFEERCKRCGIALASIAPETNISPRRQKMSRDCPRCESAETRSFEMAYASSTATGSLVATSYNFNIGATLTGGSLTQQSALAAYVTPPRAPRKDASLVVVCGFGALFVAAILCAITFGDAFPAFCFLIVVAATVSATTAVYKHQTREFQKAQSIYQEALAYWRRSWICLRCGHRWAL